MPSTVLGEPSHLRKVLKDPATPANLRARAAKMLVSLSPTLSHVVVKAPDGADVSLDGTVVGRAPLDEPIDVEPGEHEIGIRLEGRHAEVRRDMHAAREERVELALTPVATPTVTATVTAPPPVPPPPHEESVRPTAGYIVPVVLGVAGLVAVGTGIGFAVDAGNQSSDLGSTAPGVCNDMSSGGCVARKNAIDALRGDDIASVALFVGGGLALAAAVVSWLVWPSSHVRVQAALGGGGLSFTF